MKRLVIAHGWEGNPYDGWYPWLKSEAAKSGFEIIAPQLPDTNKPRIQNWVPKIAEVVGGADAETCFVGHSMGCQAIARYLETLPEGVKVGTVIFVAGFFKRLTGLEDDPDVQETDRHWLDAPLNFEKVTAHLTRSIALFSDNDPWVPLDNQDDFRDKLGSEIITEHAKGHYTGDRDKCTEIPVVLEKLLEF